MAVIMKPIAVLVYFTLVSAVCGAFICEDEQDGLDCASNVIRITRARYGTQNFRGCNQDKISEGEGNQTAECESGLALAELVRRCQGNHSCELFTDRATWCGSRNVTYEFRMALYVKWTCETPTEAPTTLVEVVTTAEPAITTTEPAITATEPAIIATEPAITATEPAITTTPTTVTSITPNPTMSSSVSTADVSAVPPAEISMASTTITGNEIVYCPEDSARNVIWPSTPAGSRSIVSCPNNLNFTAWRDCRSDGTWMKHPDLSQCVSVQVAAIQHRLSEGTALPIPEVVELLVNVTESRDREGVTASGGDIRTTAELLEQTSERLGPHSNFTMDESEKIQVIEGFVAVGNSILEEEQGWDDLSNEFTTVQTASQILSSLETSAVAVTRSLNSTRELRVGQIEMRLQIVEVEGQNAKSVVVKSSNFSTTVTYPKESIQQNLKQGKARISTIFYQKISKFLTESEDVLVTSVVLSASIATKDYSVGRMTPLSEPLSFRMSHSAVEAGKISIEQRAVAKYLCSFWNFTSLSWSQEGCRRVAGDATYSECECDHLTNFAVLMDISGTTQKLAEKHTLALQYITYVGCGISIVCLLLSWFTFQFFKNLESDRNTLHKHLVFNLCVAEILFMFSISPMVVSSNIGCAVIAAVLHFFFLTSFGWMCLEGIQLYVMLIEVFEAERSRVWYYYMVGYGVPAIIVGVSAACDPYSYGTDTYCWLRADNGFLWSFVGPVAFVILVNLIMLTIAIVMMCRHASSMSSIKKVKERTKLDRIRGWIKTALVLVILLGITWILGFFYVDQNSLVIAYAFAVLNSLQGLFIFVFHCLYNEKVQKEYKRWVRRTQWVPTRVRVSYGGHKGLYPTTSYSSSVKDSRSRFSGSFKYFHKMLNGKSKLKRQSTSSSYKTSSTVPTRGFSNGGILDQFASLGDDSAFDHGSHQRRSFTTFNRSRSGEEDLVDWSGANGDLSVIEGSVVDSAALDLYCRSGFEVSYQTAFLPEKAEHGHDRFPNQCQDQVVGVMVEERNPKIPSLESTDMDLAHGWFKTDTLPLAPLETDIPEFTRSSSANSPNSSETEPLTGAAYNHSEEWVANTSAQTSVTPSQEPTTEVCDNNAYNHFYMTSESSTFGLPESCYRSSTRKLVSATTESTRM